VNRETCGLKPAASGIERLPCLRAGRGFNWQGGMSDTLRWPCHSESAQGGRRIRSGRTLRFACLPAGTLRVTEQRSADGASAMGGPARTGGRLAAFGGKATPLRPK